MDMCGSRSVGWCSAPRVGLHSRNLFGRLMYARRERPAGAAEYRPGSLVVSEDQAGTLAAELVEWCVELFKNWYRKRVMVIVDGRRMPSGRSLRRAPWRSGAVVVSRLRKDAALFDLPKLMKKPGKGRPRKYGPNLILTGRIAADIDKVGRRSR